MKVLHNDCDPSLSGDTSLPTNAFMVEYINGEITSFDIVLTGKKVEIFDHYWDKYRENLINITQCEGRVNPKLWGNKPKEKKGKKT